ncbi:unnamed protein product, partial [Amoebophrya sp. A25]
VLSSTHFAYHAASCGLVIRFFPHLARSDPRFVRLCLQHASLEQQYELPTWEDQG